MSSNFKKTNNKNHFIIVNLKYIMKPSIKHYNKL